MTVIVSILLIVLFLLFLGAVFVIFALLKRVDMANMALVEQANRTLAMAESVSKAAPKTMDRMLDSLADSTARIHQTIESTVKSVLTPAPVQYLDAQGAPFVMPTMNEGKEPAQWDHTDSLIPDERVHAPNVDPGYEHEHDPDFDPRNPFGIPGLVSAV